MNKGGVPVGVGETREPGKPGGGDLGLEPEQATTAEVGVGERERRTGSDAAAAWGSGGRGKPKAPSLARSSGWSGWQEAGVKPTKTSLRPVQGRTLCHRR